VNVLFLDIDGVLHSERLEPTGRISSTGKPIVRYVPPERTFEWLHHLVDCLEGSDVRIVVHSTWRKRRSLDELCALLGPLGSRLLGVTQGEARWASIEAWLASHPEVLNYRILDDAPAEFPSYVLPMLFACDPTSGVSDPLVRGTLIAWALPSSKPTPVDEFEVDVQVCGSVDALGHVYLEDAQGNGYFLDHDTRIDLKGELEPGRTCRASVNSSGYALRIFGFGHGDVRAPDFGNRSATAQMDRAIVVSRARVLKEVGYFTSEELNSTNGPGTSEHVSRAREWLAQGRVFAVPLPHSRHRDQEAFLAFQFDQGQPLPVIKAVLDAFGQRKAPWTLAFWFTSNHGLLPVSARPVDLLRSAPELVLKAAMHDALPPGG
jgi:hypothetical protein